MVTNICHSSTSEAEKVDPWGSLVRQSNLGGEFQASGRLCLKYEVGSS